MEEFQVPTTPVEAEAHCADGVSYRAKSSFLRPSRLTRAQCSSRTG